MKTIKAIFDIGNYNLKGVVIGEDEGKHIILAKQVIKTKGMRKGKILDINELSSGINELYENFIKKMGGDFFDEVIIGISHPQMKIERLSEEKRIMKEEIGEDDINYLSKIISEISNKENYETIKIIPAYRIINNEKKEKDPLGLKGEKLKLVADVFMLPKSFYNTLMSIFDNLGITITDIIPNIIAASEVALDYDHKDLGSILIDIGENQSSYVVFEDGFPLTYGIVPLGGQDVTKDISIGMQIDIKEAEELKKNYGKAIIVDQKSLDKTIDELFLSNIIQARYEEIFEKINESLKEIGREGKLPAGISLIGGGSLTKNLDLLAKETFKLAAFYGKDTQLNLGELSNNPKFVNLIGCYYWSNKYTEGRKFHFNFGNKLLGNLKSLLKKIF